MTPTLQLVVGAIVLPGLSLALALAAWRALRGPSLADRVVGLDLMTTLAIGLAAALAMKTGQAALIDVGLVIALIAFLGTVGFARYIERRGPGGGS